MTADAQLQLAEVDLVDISVDDVQRVAADASTGVWEAEVSASIGDRYPAAEADRIAARRRPPARGTVRLDLPHLRDLGGCRAHSSADGGAISTPT